VTAIVAAVVVLVCGVSIRGECVLRSLPAYVADERVAAILQARVLEVQPIRLGVQRGQIATLEVQRLWKGETRREIRLYNLYDPDGREVEGQVPLQVGETYFVVARALTSAELAALGIDGPQLGTSDCNTFLFTFARNILGDAAGYPPK
jgi:hypothetical protein